jgi:hypothetical protein
MKANAVRFAAGLTVFAIGAPLPASGQFFYPPIVIVPPPTENYPAPKPKPPSPDKPNPAVTAPAQAKPAGHYEGRTWVPD